MAEENLREMFKLRRECESGYCGKSKKFEDASQTIKYQLSPY